MLRCLRWTTLLAVAVLTACGGGGGTLSSGASSGSSTSSSSSSSGSSSSSSSSSGNNFSAGGPNVVNIAVGPGPTAGSSTFNTPYVSVTVCIAGTSTCKTIADVLVDTGSVGLRLFASVVSGLTLPNQMDTTGNGNVIAECLPFADGYTWGPVASADVIIGGEKASAVPVNVIDDDGGFALPPSSCTSNGTSLNTVDNFGANGVLGVGILAQDCGPYCAQKAVLQTDTSGATYYSCGSSTCGVYSEADGAQVTNPVALFPADNNGVILQLPAIPATGATTATGYLVFGIDTESNNALGNATVLTIDPSSGTIITLFNGQTLMGVLDSGSNGLFFADNAIPNCTGSMTAEEFFCPTSTLSLSATNQGVNGNSVVTPFQIANENSLNDSFFALDDVGGSTATITGLSDQYFDFGVPFFYGHTVFTGIEGTTAGSAQGPYYAY
jgi:hypothetical protein